MTSALACWLLWLLVWPGPAAQLRRPEILRLATATAIYGGGGNFLRLATAYELRRLTAAARGLSYYHAPTETTPSTEADEPDCASKQLVISIVLYDKIG